MRHAVKGRGEIFLLKNKNRRYFPMIKMLFDYHRHNVKAPVRKVVQCPADIVGVG